MIPTWGQDDHWEQRLLDIGVVTHHIAPDDLDVVPDLPGAIVVGMCNTHYLKAFSELKVMGCKTVWANCMTLLFGEEVKVFREHGPADAYMFQSEYQRRKLEPQLKAMGYRSEQGHVIRGAFDWDEFRFRPRDHKPDADFVVGRLARPDLDKWSSNTWPIFESIPYAHRKALMMGWDEKLTNKLGSPPPWATCLPPMAISSQDFLARCHSLLLVNGGARENWPRVGLEAMSAGVPIVTQNEWGWTEMVAHAETGFLANNDAELAGYTARLAQDERLRLRMAENGRQRVQELSDPDELIRGWEVLFRGLTGEGGVIESMREVGARGMDAWCEAAGCA
jgi:hypothetical protein